MELLEVGEVAARLGVSALRVRQLANDKKLPVAVRTARGRRLADELARYVKHCDRDVTGPLSPDEPRQ